MRFVRLALTLLGVAPSMRGALGRLQDPGLSTPIAEECTVVVLMTLQGEGVQYPGGAVFECELDPSETGGVPRLTRAISGTEAQMETLRTQFNDGDLVSGETTLAFGSDARYDDEEIFLPTDLLVEESLAPAPADRRRLVSVTGDKPILAVRVTDSQGLVHPHSAAEISDNLFGTFGDSVNLKSQFADCSHGKLNVLAGLGHSQEAAPGVIEVTINKSLNNSRKKVRNAVTSAVFGKLGWSMFSYHQIMYILEDCYEDCGWAAYAFVNSWLSVYKRNYYSYVGVQLHELGHNFNLAHSGGLNGGEYSDHTCMMGNPLYSDDIGKMCYNPAKNWQLGWYNNFDGRLRLRTDQSNFGNQAVTIVGVAEYNLRTNTAAQPVTVKLETGRFVGWLDFGMDYFIGFNRAVGANAQNDEADDEVTVVQVTSRNGEGYSQSYLKATLKQGESFIIPGSSFYHGKFVEVTAKYVNTGVVPGIADVCVRMQHHSDCTPSPGSPTQTPTTRKPTPAPVYVNCNGINNQQDCDQNQPQCCWDHDADYCMQVYGEPPVRFPTRRPTSPTPPSPTPRPNPIGVIQCRNFMTQNECNGAPRLLNCIWSGGRCMEGLNPLAQNEDVGQTMHGGGRALNGCILH